MMKKLLCAQDATPGYTCYLSKNTVLIKMSDFFEMLKKTEDPKAAVKHLEK